MKPIEVNEDNFDSLLAYDDLFLDYFNAFLQYPAFPQPLYYNRLTGSFQEVEDDSPYGAVHSSGGDPRRRYYGPGDAERERIMDWARRERLPLFLRTKLFLEYKLCKLLIRPLEERRSTSRPSSRGLRGYSRETASYSSTSMSLAQSHEASAYENDSDFSWPGDADRLFLFKHLRPGSRCISMPPMLGLTVNGALWSPIDAYHSRKLSPTKNSSRGSRKVTGKSKSSRENSRPSQETEVGPGGDAGSKVTLPDVNREETQLTIKSRDTQKSRKSALKTESSKENTPKKRATIQTPSRDSSGRKSLTELTNQRPEPDGAEQQKTPSKENEDDGSDDEEDEEGIESEDESLNNDREKLEEEEEVEEEEQDEDGASIALPQAVVDEEQALENGLKEDTLIDQELRVEGDGEAEPEHSMIDYDEDLTAVDERTESEMRQVEVKHRVTFHQLKEEILGSLVGMELFKAFLAGTLGEDMLNFWLDCEMYRDNVQSMEGGADIKRTRLFRDIQDKYRFKLTPDAQKQIKQAQGNIGLSESVFTRTQYDVLRRLRSYWVARFLIHQERTGEYSYDRLRERHQRMMEDAKKPMDTFLPSISLVNSLPVRPSSCFRLATTQKDWSIVAHGGRRMEEYIRPGHLMTLDDTKYIPRPMSARFHVGLACDRDAGRPFQRYLENHSDRLLLANLLFWQDVSDYVLAEDRSADRLLLMGQAWSIFNKYIMDDGIWNIDLPPGERDFIHSTLLLTSDFAEAATFDRAKEHAVHMLQREWLHFLKEDLKVFLDCRARPEDRILSASSHRSSYSERSAVARQESLLGKLPSVHVAPATRRYKPSDESSETSIESSDNDSDPEEAAAAAALKKKNKKGGKASKEDGTSQADKEALRKQREAKKKKQIAMQRKLVRQARARQQAAQKGAKANKQGVKFEGKDGKDQGKAGAAGGDGKGDKKPEDEKEATFKKMFKNKSVMNLFRTYVQDFESKDVNNMVQMYFDVDVCYRIPETHADKRTSISKQIYNNFFDPNSKSSHHTRAKGRAIPLNRDVLARQNSEGDRLSTKTMDMASKSVLPQIEEAFQNFWASYMESGDDPGLMGERVEGTATSRTESTQSMVLAYKRRRRGKGPHRQSGQQMPTAQDKNEFQTLLIKSARGIPSHKLMYFHRYLMDYNGKDGGADYLDKDLVFYLEAQRFKEACHSNMDISLLKRKVEVILDCFIDSPLSNSGILVDISTEMASKVMKKADIFLKDTGKDPHNPNFFDDAQYALFKEMLPYFAAFSKRYQQPSYQQDRLPYSKYEKLARDRLRKFMDMKEPSTEFKLPLVNNPPQNRTGGTGITFSIGDGLQWKVFDGNEGNDAASEVGSIQVPRSARASTRDSSSTPGSTHQKQYRSNLTRSLDSIETPPRPSRVSVVPRLSVVVQDL
ncbi:uncharacterized protein LOC121418690 isoform X4 [Lytechinus variegatus]|uniref:uncharacterized protein LOC121418690 isoform X4 n=1 Tax=Lytechinus variegatus TaxID=7654 RepID=UPI001BB1A269|nr:uncharacterized protein LOC121418690 isoform X4 [Lytechinus variegatus]